MAQERLLSPMKSAEQARRTLEGMLEVSLAKYLPGGSKIAFQVKLDHGVEIYDLVENRKWRFAPGHGQLQGEGWGAGFVVVAKECLIASIDPDAVRFWKVPIGGMP